MNVVIYRLEKEDCWKLVNSAGEICILDELPSFYDVLEFRNSKGEIAKWQLEYFLAARRDDPYWFYGELRKPLAPTKIETPKNTYQVFVSHSSAKRFFRRAFAYVGLYAEIFSALCRWMSTDTKAKWRSFVTMNLVWTGYLPPPKNVARHVFASHQRENIQRCLRVSPRALEAVRRQLNPDSDEYKSLGS